jgi:hypothetical protein
VSGTQNQRKALRLGELPWFHRAVPSHRTRAAAIRRQWDPRNQSRRQPGTAPRARREGGYLLGTWSRRDGEFAAIAHAAEALPARHAVLDGEAISQDEHGIADFHALRRQLAGKGDGNLTYYAFDLLYLEGEDLRPQPLLRRK